MRWSGLGFVVVIACTPTRPPANGANGSTESPASEAPPKLEGSELPASADAQVRAIADACAKDNATACLVLGVAHSDATHGLSANEPRAVDMYERACTLGEIRGCNNLAVAFEKGKGRPVDLKRAVEIYARNCEAKHALACRNLGRSHRDGLGVPADPAKAKAAFLRANELSQSDCEAKVAEGCSNLGFMFRSGTEGVPKDEKRAQEYLQRACDLGYTSICGRVKESN